MNRFSDEYLYEMGTVNSELINGKYYCHKCGNHDVGLIGDGGKQINCGKCNSVLAEKRLKIIDPKTVLGVKDGYWSGCNGCGNKTASFMTTNDGNKTIKCYCGHVLYKNGRIFN
jgi:ribosomal protein S27E